MYPNSIKNLIDSFKYLPGIGEKTAERLALAVLNIDEDQAKFFSDSIIDVKNKIHKCEKCNTLTEDELCFVCNNPTRDKNILCVVDDTKNVFLFERLGMFNGYYHVLDGLISPLDGINPEDIGLDKLIDRITKDKYKEVILAFKPSIEGETTALYIKKILSDMDVVVSRLASGIPMGADMEYIDGLTLERALKDRKEIE